jgi:hypothetical protein
MCISSHVGPVVRGVFLKEENVEQEVPVVHKPQVVRSLTRRWSKASPGAYSTYRLNSVSWFTSNACDALCTTCRALFENGDRLHTSTRLYTILDVACDTHSVTVAATVFK